MKLHPIENPPNPYLSEHHEWLEPPPLARLEVYEEDAASILSKNDSPDIPFAWSVNPYRGCQHACAYCYARPYHEYLGFGAGTDFDTKIVVKRNTPGLLAKAFSKKSWRRESVTFSGITDCYQPLEASYGLTRGCLSVCRDFCNPACIITRSFLIVRDAALLASLNELCQARVFISIPTADPEVAKALEPNAPPPERRLEAIRRLHEAGVPVGVMVAPIIPGLTDRDGPTILEQAAKAGAQWAGFTPLRLPGNVETVFLSRLRERLPLHADRVISRIREMRNGQMNDGRFTMRFTGQGEYWRSVVQLFQMQCDRWGLSWPSEQDELSVVKRFPSGGEVAVGGAAHSVPIEPKSTKHRPAVPEYPTRVRNDAPGEASQPRYGDSSSHDFRQLSLPFSDPG